MAAIFPLDTSQPWVFNGVTYEHDAVEDRWYVVSTVATDQVVDNINTLNQEVIRGFDERDDLIELASSKNNSQDAEIAELDQRVDTLSEAVGILEFKGRYTYVLEKSVDACTAAYAACLLEAAGDVPSMSECNRLKSECEAAVGDPYPDGSFTSTGTTNVIDVIEEFVFTATDMDGVSFDWINLVEEDDYIEFFEQNNGDTALYQCIQEPTIASTQVGIKVKFLKQTGEGDGNFNLQEEYEVRILKSKLGLDVVAADERYVRKPYVVYFEDDAVDIVPQHSSGNLQNGELWYDTDSLELFVYNNNAWTASARPPSADNTVQSLVADVDQLRLDAYYTTQRLNTVISEALLENNIYYSDDPPTGDIYGTLRNGDLWIDSDDLSIKFYSQGAWVNPDRQVGGDYLEKSGGEMSGKLVLKKPRGDSASNNLVVWGRVNGTETVLLKDYQRKNDQSAQDDYIEYYGDTPDGYSIMNRNYADDRYIMADGDDMRGKLVLGRCPSNTTGFTIRGRKASDQTVGELLSVFHNGGTVPDAVNYAGKTDNDANIQTKASVEALIGATLGVPVGAIMMWMGASAPDGWLFCRGNSFDISTYPLLHAHLQEMHGYVSGKTPDFKGYFPGGAGAGPANLTPDQAGYTHAAKTGQPSGGPPTSNNTNVPDGTTRGFSAAGSTNAYSAGAGPITINNGWDSVTRPPTLSVNFIIKHD